MDLLKKEEGEVEQKPDNTPACQDAGEGLMLGFLVGTAMQKRKIIFPEFWKDHLPQCDRNWMKTDLILKDRIFGCIDCLNQAK